MREPATVFERRTKADLVFEQLRQEIVTLKLLPGAKLSEAEIAQRFGVSRQPVRDAFNRLDNLDLLLIQPQKATEVRGFSMSRIVHLRFIRLAVELEVIRQACSIWDASCARILAKNLDQQQDAIDRGQTVRFRELDYEFHRLICELGEQPSAFETIDDCKRHVDRLCALSLNKAVESKCILEDHKTLAHALKDRSIENATSIIRTHLSRLDETILSIHESHHEYFE